MVEEGCPIPTSEETAEVTSVMPTDLSPSVVSAELQTTVVPVELPTDIHAELSAQIKAED